MSLINQIETKSEQEIISILQENGIQVVMKPIALMPDSFSMEGYGKKSVYFEQMDIYDALRRLETRAKIARDPFSQT